MFSNFEHPSRIPSTPNRASAGFVTSAVQLELQVTSAEFNACHLDYQTELMDPAPEHAAGISRGSAAQQPKSSSHNVSRYFQYGPTIHLEERFATL